MADVPFTIARISSRAERFLRRLPRKQQEAIAEAFDFLCRSPFSHPNPTVIRPLKGKLKGSWRYRLGGLRIIYSINEQDLTIHIVAIDNRGDVY